MDWYNDPAAPGFFSDGSAGQPSFMSRAWANPGFGPMMTNMGLGLIAAGAGGGAPRSRMAEAAPYIGQGMAQAQQAKVYDLQSQLVGAKLKEMRDRTHWRDRIVSDLTPPAPDWINPDTGQAQPGAPDRFAGVPENQRRAAASLIEAGVEPEKLLPSLLPKTSDPKDRLLNVSGVGLVDISGETPRVVMAAKADPKDRYMNVPNVGLIDTSGDAPRVALPVPKEDGGAFDGNGMDGQVYNKLLALGPKVANGTATPQEQQVYTLAYSHATQPRLVGDQVNGFQMMTPALPSQFPNPNATRQQPPQSAAPQAPATQPTMPTAPIVGGPAPSQVNVADRDTPRPATSDVSLMPEQPQAIPAPTVAPLGQGTGVSAADRSKLKQIEADATTMIKTLDSFGSAVAGADFVDFADAFAGGNTAGGRKLNTAWANAALMSKAEALYNLGVLNGPDLGVIRETLPDPSTFKGQFVSKGAYSEAVKGVKELITNKLEAYRIQYSGAKADKGSKGDSPKAGGGNVPALPAGFELVE